MSVFGLLKLLSWRSRYKYFVRGKVTSYGYSCYLCAMRNYLDVVVELGERLRCNAHGDVIERATVANEWFTREGVESSIVALCDQMLAREKLEQWLASYSYIPKAEARDVAIIMAGNIPLVGFFDFLCVLLAGHRAWIKPSSKDEVLMQYVVDILRELEPSIPIYVYSDERLYDAVIATGGENAMRYFESRFGGVRLLARSNRHSVAVVDGEESEEMMRGLAKDIYTHSGLGCRNVSMIFTPRGYMPNIEGGSVAQGYKNNYMQSRTVAELIHQEVADNGVSLFVKSRTLPSSLSTISLYEYDTLEEVEQWLAEHESEVQCVVGRCIEHPRRVDFGQAQSPSLSDYPDGVDVMEFLNF